MDAVLPETLYEFFMEELSRGLEPSVRTGLELLAAMPLVDRELVVTLFGAERAEGLVGEALALGILDERGDHLVFHPLVAEFFEKRSRGEKRLEAADAFETAWAYYTAQKEPDAAFDLAHQLGVPSDIDRLLIDTMDELLNSARLSTLETWVGRAVRLVGETPAVLVAQAEVALRRGRHLTAQALADRAVQGVESDGDVLYRAYLVGGRAAHIGQREEDALELCAKAESAGRSERQRREARWGRLTAAASLEHDAAWGLLEELQVTPTGDFDPTEALRTADKKLALGLRFGSIRSLPDAKTVEELLPSVPDPFVRCSFRCMLSCALNLAADYGHALRAAIAMQEDATEFRVEFALPYASLMRATALAGLRRFDEAYGCLDAALGHAIRCTDSFGQQSVYTGRVRALLHEGRVAEACALEPPDLTDSLPGMRGEVWSSRGLALACIGRLDEARDFAEKSLKTTRAIESTVLARCVTAVTALKARDRTQTKCGPRAPGYRLGDRSCRLRCHELPSEPRSTRRTPPRLRNNGDCWIHPRSSLGSRARCDDWHRSRSRARSCLVAVCEGAGGVRPALRGLSESRDRKAASSSPYETVKVHARHVYDKLGIRSRTALALQAASRRPQAAPTASSRGEASESSAADG